MGNQLTIQMIGISHAICGCHSELFILCFGDHPVQTLLWGIVWRCLVFRHVRKIRWNTTTMLINDSSPPLLIMSTESETTNSRRSRRRHRKDRQRSSSTSISDPDNDGNGSVTLNTPEEVRLYNSFVVIGRIVVVLLLIITVYAWVYALLLISAELHVPPKARGSHVLVFGHVPGSYSSSHLSPTVQNLAEIDSGNNHNKYGFIITADMLVNSAVIAIATAAVLVVFVESRAHLNVKSVQANTAVADGARRRSR